MKLTREERRLRVLLWAHAGVSVLFALGYLVGGDTASLGFIPNSLAKDGLFAVLSVLGAADVRKRAWTAPVLALAYVFLVAGQLAAIVHSGAPAQDVLGVVHVSATVALLAWMAIDLVLIVWFTAWWLAAVKAREGLRFLNPVAFLGLASLADVLVEGGHETLTPREIARNVDDFLADLDSPRRDQVRLALTALGLVPPWLPL